MPLEYRSAPELVRLHEQLLQEITKQERRAQAATNLRGVDVLSSLLPLVRGTLDFSALLQADLAAYATQVGEISGDGGEVILGIDEDIYADLDQPLRAAVAEITEVLEVDNLNGAAPKLRNAVKLIEDVRAALADLVVEEDEEGSEPLEGEDEDGDDEPLDVDEEE